MRLAELQARHRLIEELHTMPYDRYLQTTHWQWVRRITLARAQYRCQICGLSRRAGAYLEVHHNTYERRGFEWEGDVVALCSDCHRLHHADREEAA